MARDKTTFTEELENLIHGDGSEAKVVAEIQEIPVSAELDFDNLFGKYTTNQDQTEMGGNLPIGSGKLYAMRYGLVSIWVDDEKLNTPFQNPAANFPPVRDAETRESIIIKVVQAVVKHNQWLGQLQPYAGVFMPFLPPEAETANPTRMLSGSSKKSSDTTETPDQSDSSDSVTVMGQGGTPEV